MANKVYSLAKLLMVASLFVLKLLDMTVSAKKAEFFGPDQTRQLPVCSLKPTEVGCFKDKTDDRALPELLLTARDTTSKVYFGENITWNDFASFTRRFTCACALKAKQMNYEYFGIEFFGECWSGMSAYYHVHGPSGNCKMVKEEESAFEACDEQRNKLRLCVGDTLSLYVYKTGHEQPSTMPPPPPTTVFSGLHNVFCGAYETVVPVDPTGHEYYPFFVKLHRCAGSASTVSPNVQHCVAKTYDNIQVGSAIMMINHTSCAHACVASPDDCDSSVQVWNDSLCACKCRELICKDGFRWNNITCRCVCDRYPVHCPYNQEWSDDICGCRCQTTVVDECTRRKMEIDVDCQCVDVLDFSERKGVYKQTHYDIFITLLIGQAVVIILLICALVHGRKRNSAHSPLDRLDSCKTEDDVAPPPYQEVAIESYSSESLECAKDSSDNDSYTAPLSPKERIIDI